MPPPPPAPPTFWEKLGETALKLLKFTGRAGCLMLFVFIVVTSYAVAYFVRNMGDKNYLHGFMGNLLATLLAAIIGIPIALAFSRWQELAQKKRQAKKEKKEFQERSDALIVRFQTELQTNVHILYELRKALDEVKEPSSLFWDWCVAISDSFSFESYDEIVNTKLESYFYFTFYGNEFFKMYKGLKVLVHQTKVAQAAHRYYMRISSPHPKEVAEILENVRKTAFEITPEPSHLDFVMNDISRIRKRVQRPGYYWD